VLLDFDSGRTLQLVGRAEIRWHADDAGTESKGTDRCWDFQVRRWREATLASPIAWDSIADPPARSSPDSSL
jgi:hypothetical protein